MKTLQQNLIKYKAQWKNVFQDPQKKTFSKIIADSEQENDDGRTANHGKENIKKNLGTNKRCRTV